MVHSLSHSNCQRGITAKRGELARIKPMYNLGGSLHGLPSIRSTRERPTTTSVLS